MAIVMQRSLSRGDCEQNNCLEISGAANQKLMFDVCKIPSASASGVFLPLLPCLIKRTSNHSSPFSFSVWSTHVQRTQGA